MTKKVVVIGTGPSALATAKTLLASHYSFDITVVDVKSDTESETKIGLKSYFGSTEVYDQTDSGLKHKNMKPVTWPSAGYGGFSRIWGAVIGENLSANFPTYIRYEMGDKESTFSTVSALRLKERYLKTKKPKWKAANHVVAVDPVKCVMCGNCLTGCPKDAIWFAGDEWKDLNRIHYKENFRAHTLEKTASGVVITSNAGERLDSDHVFLAAGAIASSQILMRSNLIANKISLVDTATTFFPAFRLPVKESDAKFSLSQLSAEFRIGNNIQSYIQIYPDSRMLAEPIIQHKPKLKFIVKTLWSHISPFMLSVIMYENSHVSSSLDLELNNDGKFEISKSKSKKAQKQRATKFLSLYYLYRDFGIIPLVFLGKKGEAGESYHFGSVKEIIQINNKRDETTIRIVDSSALPLIEPGPITDKVMNNANKIVSDFLESYNEISN